MSELSTNVQDRNDGIVAQAKRHRTFLGVALAIIVATFLLDVRPDQRVALRGVPSVVLPETCASMALFNAECPGCGLTRSFIWAGRGEWRRSLEMNRVGFLIMLVVVGQIPYRLVMLKLNRRGTTAESPWPGRIAVALVAALFVNWTLRLLGY